MRTCLRGWARSAAMPSKLNTRICSAIAYKYAIDVFSSEQITGWCFHRFNKKKPLVLVFSRAGVPLGECAANTLREDLKQLSLHPNGVCGFSFAFPEPLDLLDSQSNEEISICVKNTRDVLCNLKLKQADNAVGRPAHAFSQIRRQFSITSGRPGKVVFMHIPKTAGTTFNTFAKSVYPTGRAISHIEAFDVEEYPNIAREYQFISGHLDVGQLQQHFPKSEYKFYTLIREPYAQLHSHLNWLKGIGADKSTVFYQTHHPFFKEIADYLMGKNRLSNDDLQSIVDNLRGVLLPLLDNNQTRYFLIDDCEKVEQSHLEIAQENSGIFTQIGTTEKYQRFKQAFCRQHQFKYAQSKHTSNLNTSRMAALYDYQDPVTQEILYPLVSKDISLYQQFNQAT